MTVIEPAMQEMNEAGEAEFVARLQGADVPGAIARGLAARRPYADAAALCQASDGIVLELSDAALCEALASVPPPVIGGADEGTRAAAHTAIDMYRERFGYPFVTGIETPTAEELLMRVRIRLGNEPAPELRAAREHLRRYVRTRLLRAVPQSA
jgi:2-oxo-4-hydroxy-4-carboxy-5-ureidoimidazoline decarboxylase